MKTMFLNCDLAVKLLWKEYPNSESAFSMLEESLEKPIYILFKNCWNNANNL